MDSVCRSRRIPDSDEASFVCVLYGEGRVDVGGVVGEGAKDVRPAPVPEPVLVSDLLVE